MAALGPLGPDLYTNSALALLPSSSAGNFYHLFLSKYLFLELTQAYRNVTTELASTIKVCFLSCTFLPLLTPLLQGLGYEMHGTDERI